MALVLFKQLEYVKGGDISINAHKIIFTPKEKSEFGDDILELIWDYLGCLYKNGQILKNYELIESNDVLWALVTLPDDDALRSENNNMYINKYLNSVMERFNISFESLGKKHEPR